MRVPRIAPARPEARLIRRLCKMDRGGGGPLRKSSQATSAIALILWDADLVGEYLGRHLAHVLARGAATCGAPREGVG